MMRIRSAMAAALIGCALSGCAGLEGLEENTLLAPSRARPDLGVRLRVIPPFALPANVRGTRSQLLWVVLVRPGRPAALAGIRPGDILLALDGKPVSGVEDSVGIMQTHRWGDTVVLTILRDDRMQRVPVVLTP